MPRAVRIGWFIHVAFISILIVQLLIAFLFYTESNRRYFENLHVDDYNRNIIDFLDRESGARYLQNIVDLGHWDRSIRTFRHRLVVQRVSDIISLQAQPEWNGLRACRTLFKGGIKKNGTEDPLTRFDSCIALPDHMRDGKDRGRYIVIHVATIAPLGEKSKGGLDLNKFGRVEVALATPARESRFLIARESGGPIGAQSYLPTLFHQSPEGKIGKPVDRANCVVKSGFGSVAGTGIGFHYLCRVPMGAVSIFSGIEDPYDARFLASIHPRVTIFPFDRNAGHQPASFGTTDKVGGEIRDREGEPVQSIWSELPAMDHPAFEDKSLIRLCIRDRRGRSVVSDHSACSESALSQSHEKRSDRTSLSGLTSILYFDDQAFRKQWFERNKMLITGYALFILFTLLTYRIVVANVLAPIRDIAGQAQRIDLLSVNSVKYASRVEEVSSLSRSINSIKFNAATAIRGMLEKQTELSRRLNHDLATPLLVLKARVGADHPLHRQVQELLAAVERFERGRSVPDAFADRFIKLERTNLVAVVRTLIDDHQAIVAGSRNLGWNFSSPSIMADIGEVEFRESINHILTNARRHTKHGDTIAISLDYTSQNITVTIENSGSHIDDDALPRIFELGFSTSEDGASLGQGLYAAKVYLNKMGGDIRAENSKVGVRFVILLPNPMVASRISDGVTL